MDRKLLLSLIFLLTGFSLCINAQEGESLSVEELYLRTSVQTEIIKSAVASGERSMKYLALDTMETMIDEGTFNPDDPVMMTILNDMAMEGVGNQVVESGQVMNDFPVLRKDAVELLGRVGGEDARRKIFSILDNEQEYIVLGEAVIALAKIGLDEEGIGMDKIISLGELNNNTDRDRYFAQSILTALELIVDNNQDSLKEFPTAFVMITRMADSSLGYSEITRKKAMSLIDNFLKNA